jgi:hypothetical protein
MRLQDVETLHWLALHPEAGIINYMQSMFDTLALPVTGIRRN